MINQCLKGVGVYLFCVNSILSLCSNINFYNFLLFTEKLIIAKRVVNNLKVFEWEELIDFKVIDKRPEKEFGLKGWIIYMIGGLYENTQFESK